MKIAQVTPIYPPALGGIGQVAGDYTNILRAEGYEVDVFTVGKIDQESGVRNQERKRNKLYKSRGVFSYGHAAIIPSLLWRLRGYDLIHLHFPFYGSDLFVALASLIWKTPLVITYHMKNKASGLLRFLFTFHKLWQWFVFWRASAVLVSSLDYARSAKLKHRNLVAMPFWVDVGIFHSEGKIESRHKLQIPIQPFVFLFVGGLDDAHYFKGVDVLIEACSKLRIEYPWRLIIAGDGNLKSKYENLSKERNLESKITFVGRVSDLELPDYYRSADVHILPAIDRSEAFGLVTLEAASSGRPSVVSDLPGVRTLVEHQNTGLIVPINNPQALMVALTWLSQHKDKMLEFGQNARKMAVDKYSKAVIVDKLQEVYRRCKLPKRDQGL